MASTSSSESKARRVIIRAHERWHDEYQKITQDWFHFAGYSTREDEYDWTTDHYVHLGGVNDGRFHLFIDMEKNSHCTDFKLDNTSLEIYRLRKPDGQASKFEYISPEKQEAAYVLAHKLTEGLPWGHD